MQISLVQILLMSFYSTKIYLMRILGYLFHQCNFLGKNKPKICLLYSREQKHMLLFRKSEILLFKVLAAYFLRTKLFGFSRQTALLICLSLQIGNNSVRQWVADLAYQTVSTLSEVSINSIGKSFLFSTRIVYNFYMQKLYHVKLLQLGFAT